MGIPNGSLHSGDVVWKAFICAALAVLLYLLKIYFRGAQFTDDVRADGKVGVFMRDNAVLEVVVITGANSGVGKATAQLLNLRGAKVYMLCRDRERAEEARKQMIEAGCDPLRLIVRIVDLGDFKTIRTFTRQFRDEEPKLDILINNAGHMGLSHFEKTVDGFEKTWQSNYLGHFLLTEQLLPQLIASQDGRIVSVASLMHHYGDSVRSEVHKWLNRLTVFQIVNSPEHYGYWVWEKLYGPYSRSKLAQVMHARWLSKLLRVKGVNVTINTLHPGTVDSNILGPTGYAFLRQLFRPIFWFFFKSEEDGAQTSLYLALSPKIRGVSGKYFRDCVPEATHPMVEDDKECELLYQSSKEAVAEKR